MPESIAIRTESLTKRYGTVPVVDGLDLEIRRGELVSLLGPNGAGKTTTIGMLSCLISPTSGRAAVMGFDLRTQSLAVRQVIAVSPQETAIAPRLSARENLELMGGLYGLGKREIADRSERLLSIMDLCKRDREPVKRFSGGMQRKLSVAMALMTDPAVLFLDEPSLGLDPQARRDLWSFIETLKGGTTVLLTTHYLEEADSLSDRIAVIGNGRLIAEGTPSELKQRYRGVQSIRITSRNLSPASVEAIRREFGELSTRDDGVVIRTEDGDFDRIVDFLRSRGERIEGISTIEPTLDDVFFAITGRAASAEADGKECTPEGGRA